MSYYFAPSLLSLMFFVYLLGSFPTGYLISRLSAGKNVLEVGWRKTSGSNVYRNVGKWQGVLTALLDFAKGYLAVWLAQNLGLPFQIQASAGALAVLGHNWSVFLKFAGGRGIGTFAGALLALSPVVFGLSAIFFAVFAPLLNMSLATLVSLFAVVFFSAYLNQFGAVGASGLFALLCLPLILVKRLSPIKEIFPVKQNGILIRNRLLLDSDLWKEIRIKKYFR
jgi:glycerol-3-phosphate acyltransferase PlsY